MKKASGWLLTIALVVAVAAVLWHLVSRMLPVTVDGSGQVSFGSGQEEMQDRLKFWNTYGILAVVSDPMTEQEKEKRTMIIASVLLPFANELHEQETKMANLLFEGMSVERSARFSTLRSDLTWLGLEMKEKLRLAAKYDSKFVGAFREAGSRPPRWYIVKDVIARLTTAARFDFVESCRATSLDARPGYFIER